MSASPENVIYFLAILLVTTFVGIAAFLAVRGRNEVEREMERISKAPPELVVPKPPPLPKKKLDRFEFKLEAGPVYYDEAIDEIGDDDPTLTFNREDVVAR